VQPLTVTETIDHLMRGVHRTLIPSPWHICVHPQGWIYFFHPILKILTVEDIRDPGVHDLVMQKSLQYATDDEDLEIKLFGISLITVPFDHLVVNHAHCVASHEFSEVQSKNVSNLHGQACKYFSKETLAKADPVMNSVSRSSTLLELCKQASGTLSDTRGSSARCSRCSCLVLRKESRREYPSTLKSTFCRLITS